MRGWRFRESWGGWGRLGGGGLLGGESLGFLLVEGLVGMEDWW